jgi:Leucine-rich repeat (LRR) protein
MFVALTCFSNGYTQKAKAKREPLKHEQEVRDMVSFLQFMLNTLGDAKTSARDKDVMITESFTKIFRDGKVQIQDDLDEDRTVITNKDVPAYLKDVDFFFKHVQFEFNIESIEAKGTEDDRLFYKVTLTRNLKGTLADGKPVNNTIPRFIEINYDQKAQDLKIVSIYTKEYDEKKALLAWWSDLSYEWREIFKQKLLLGDSVTLEQIMEITQIDSLDISNNHYLLNLDPLGRLPDLQYLSLSHTHVRDLSPIRNLTELHELNLSNSKVDDISPLRYAINLQRLNIGNTLVKDVSVFEKLVNLQILEMPGAVVNTFEPLKNLHGLIKLNLQSARVNNLSFVDSLVLLQDLNISETSLSDISPLSALTAIINLNLDSTKVLDFGPLAGLTHLKVLSVNGTAFNNFEPVVALPALERIYCDATGITQEAANDFMAKHPNTLVIYDSKDLRTWWQDLSPVWKDVLRRAASVQQMPTNEELAKVTSLDSINVMNYVSVKSLEPLRKIPMVRIILASSSGISDLSFIKDHHSITLLDISGTQVADLSPLVNLDNLRILKADKTRVNSIDTLSSNKNLHSIYVDGTVVTESSIREFLKKRSGTLIVYKTAALQSWWETLPTEWRDIFRTQIGGKENFTREQLHELVLLKKLQFQNVPVTDLAPLKQFVRLEGLEFTGTAIKDLSPLKPLVSLTDLVVRDNPVKDLEPLKELNDLHSLDISNTPVDDLEVVGALSDLRSVNCAGTQIKKLNALKELKNLAYLDCSNTDVRTLNVVADLPLTTLKCYNTNISKSEVKKFKKANPDCNVIYYR